jgi:hypothetical protein
MKLFKALLYLLSLLAVTDCYSQKAGCKHGDCENGQGSYLFNDGDTYYGGWKNKKMNGRGTYVWKDGSKYIGMWVDDLRNGYGQYIDSNNNVFEGEWKNGMQNGRGEYRGQDGTMWRGEWKDNKWHGRGELTYPNGNILTGTWDNGVYVNSDSDQKKPEQTYPQFAGPIPTSEPLNQFNSQGKPEGLWVTYLPKDNSPHNHTGNPQYIRNIGHYRNGVKDGKWLYYGSNFVVSEENYKNGIKDGKQVTYWMDSGSPRYIENYKNGLLNGLYEEYSHGYGNLVLYCNYSNGQKSGQEIEYYDTSSIEPLIKATSNYTKGELDGESIYYNKDGGIISKTLYEKGLQKWTYNFETAPRN